MNVWKSILALSFLFIFLLPQSAWASSIKVMVDPGHGGFDPGAIGVNGLFEKNVNLDIALKLRDELEKDGYEVVMTRTSDVYLSLPERVSMAEKSNADLFVSIHANSHPSPLTSGSLVLYYDSQAPQQAYPASSEMTALSPVSKQLAQQISQFMAKTTGVQNRGLMQSAAYVIRMGKIPSVLVETAFLSNWNDAVVLGDSSMKTLFAEGIAKGIEAFQMPVFPDLAGHWAKDAVLRMKDKGILQGENNNLFLPDRALSRAEFFTVMERMFTFEETYSTDAPMNQSSSTVSGDTYGSLNGESSGQTGDHPGIGAPVSALSAGSAVRPSDLSTKHWAYQILFDALQQGYISGYPDGTIRPDQPVTRAEAATIFKRFLVSQKVLDPSLGALLRYPFEDVPANNWSAPAVYPLRNLGLIDGITNNRFYPGRTMSRAEMAAMIDKYYAKGYSTTH